MTSTILFLRGFNTYKTDDLFLGPINLGPAHQHIESLFQQQNFNFYPITQIGRGTFEEQTAATAKSIQNIIAQEKISGPIHLLGHSAGGVWLRAALHHLKTHEPQIKSLVSITSPHRGSQLAEHILQVKAEKPRLHKSLQYLGYDLDPRVDLFSSWTRDNVATVNLKYPDLSNISYASIVSGSPYKKLSAFFKIINAPFPTKKLLSDGIVEVTSQPWGKVLGEYTLDHGGVLGFRTYASPRKANRKKDEFKQMIHLISDHFRKSE